MRAVSTFTVDSFDPTPPQGDQDPFGNNRMRLEKTFTGEIEGHSKVEMLAMRNDVGAGYVALEHFSGSVKGVAGGFSILHLGTIVGTDQWAKWPLAPGSGSGDLRAIRGEAQIDIDADGGHTLILDYALG
jgi:hypothetical protein